MAANGRPNRDYPTDLLIACMNRGCDFNRDRPLPIVAVDEPIYRRLPCFLIATVDKFAGMPWTGPIAGFFGRVQRFDKQGFYGACDPDRGSMLPGGRQPEGRRVLAPLHLVAHDGRAVGLVFGMMETDRILIIVPMFHANAWGTPYGAWMAGTDMIMPQMFLMGEQLAAVINEHHPTLACGVPTIWNGLLALDSADRLLDHPGHHGHRRRRPRSPSSRRSRSASGRPSSRAGA